MGFLNSSGVVDIPQMVSFLERCNVLLKKVIVPYGRLAVRFHVPNPMEYAKTVAKHYQDEMNDVSKVPVPKKSIFDGAVVIEFPESEYRIDSIPGAWDEFISRAFAPAKVQAYLGIGQLDSVIRFRTQLALKINQVLESDEVVRDMGVALSSDVDCVPDDGSYGKLGMTLHLILKLTSAELV